MPRTRKKTQPKKQKVSIKELLATGGILVLLGGFALGVHSLSPSGSDATDLAVNDSGTQVSILGDVSATVVGAPVSGSSESGDTKTPAPAPALTTAPVPKPADCLEQLFGGDRASQILNGQPMTSAEVTQATAVCFNVGVSKDATPSPRPSATSGSGSSGSGEAFSPVSVLPSGISAEPAPFSCVAAKLGTSAAQSIFDHGKLPPTGLGAAAACFKSQDDSLTDSESTSVSQTPSATVFACLAKQGVTSTTVQSIAAGSTAPNTTQLKDARDCYESTNSAPFIENPKQVSDTSAAALCAKAILGVTDLTTVKPQTLTADQRKQVQACYTPSQPALAPAAKPSLSSTVESCLQSALGDSFAQIQAGQTVPTDAQKAAAKSCFNKDNSSASAAALTMAKVVAPSQAEALLTATENDSDIPRPVIKSSDTAATIEISGSVKADVASADIFVNSDSQIITVPVTNHTWSVSLPSADLATGVQHTAYAVATTSAGLERSTMVAFDVSSPSSSTTVTPSPSSIVASTPGGTANPSNTDLYLEYAAVAICLLGAGWFIIRRLL